MTILDAPNHFWLPESSTTSTTPGRKGSIEGTWLDKIPISPDSAGMFTWTTSWELKMAYTTSKIPCLIRITSQFEPCGEVPMTTWVCHLSPRSHALYTQHGLLLGVQQRRVDAKKTFWRIWVATRVFTESRLRCLAESSHGLQDTLCKLHLLLNL